MGGEQFHVARHENITSRCSCGALRASPRRAPTMDLSSDIMWRHHLGAPFPASALSGASSTKRGLATSTSLPTILVKDTSLKPWSAAMDHVEVGAYLSQRFPPPAFRPRRVKPATPEWATVNTPPALYGRSTYTGMPHPRPLALSSIGSATCGATFDMTRPLAPQLGALYMRRLTTVFDAYRDYDDDDGTDDISLRDFHSAMRSVGLGSGGAVDMLWEHLPKTTDGGVRYADLMSALAIGKPPARDGGERARARDGARFAFADLAAEHVRSVFAAWDTDSSGCLSRYELAKAMASLGLGGTREVLHALFDEIDTDGSGTIEYAELAQAFNSGHQRHHAGLHHSMSSMRLPPVGSSYALLPPVGTMGNPYAMAAQADPQPLLREATMVMEHPRAKLDPRYAPHTWTVEDHTHTHTHQRRWLLRVRPCASEGQHAYASVSRQTHIRIRVSGVLTAGRCWVS